MKHLLTLVICLAFLGVSRLNAQLPDGSSAPDFTLTDINGNSHHLYDYLAQGKMVILDFSATWCLPCWNYMLTGALETVWEEHGPNGDNTAMVFFIEADFSTGMDDLLGQTPESQGNWVAAIPYPIIDLQPGQNTASQYQIAYYPTLYAVCAEETTWELGQVGAATWSSFITSCTLEGEIENIEHAWCFGDGSIDGNYTGGVPPIAYQWSTGATTPSINNISAGTYWMKVTDSGGKWVKIEDIIVNGPDDPMAVTETTLQQPLCNGNSNGAIDIEFGGGTPGYQYEWSNGSATQDLNNIQSGNYTLTVTDINGCTYTEAFFVDEPDELLSDIYPSPENCEQGDGTATLDIEGGTGPYEISCTSGIVVGNQILNLSQGFHTATVEDVNGCMWQEVFEIEHLEAPDVEISQGPDLTCLQLTTTLSGFATLGSGEYEYEWTTTDGHIVSGAFSETVVVDAGGTYNLIVTDFISGCETPSSHEVVPVIITPEVNAGDDLPISCENTQVTIQGSGDPANTINWTTSTGNIISGANTYTPLVDAPGDYFIHVTNSQTGCSNDDTVQILNQLFPANAAFQYLTSSLTVIATDISTGSNLSGWFWTFGDGDTSNVQSPVHTYATAGMYEVCLSVQNGCGISQSCSQVEVSFVGSVISLNAQISNVLCFGGATGSIILTVNGGSGNYTYTWTAPDGSSYSTQNIQDLVAGTYIIVVTDDAGNSVAGGFTVTQPDQLLLGASTIIDNLCFGQTNGSIAVDLAGGVGPYLYSWNGGPSQPENIITQLSAGLYECVVTDSNGCQLPIGPYIVLEPAAIINEITITDALCHGDQNGSCTLNTSGGVAPYLYSINGGPSTSSSTFTGLAADTFMIQVKDANACIQEIPVIVDEPDVLAVNVSQVTDASAGDHNDGSITIQVTGGTEPYTVAWSNGGNGLSIQGLLPGEYTYTVLDANGCLLTSQGPIVVGTSVGTQELEALKYLTILPNPSHGDVIVKWKDLYSADANLSVVNMDGKTLAAISIGSVEGSWNMSELSLSEGMYIIFLRQDQKVYPYKLIIL